MVQMTNHGTVGSMEFYVPSRLIGFRTEFLTETRAPASPTTSSMTTSPGLHDHDPADGFARRGPLGCRHVLRDVQPPRARQSPVEPTTEVYEGMIVGEKLARRRMDVNITKEKKLSNVRLAPVRTPCPAAPTVTEQSRSSAARTNVSRSPPRRCESARSNSTRPSGAGPRRGPATPDAPTAPGASACAAK